MQEVVGRGVVDGARIAVGGHSYGLHSPKSGPPPALLRIGRTLQREQHDTVPSIWHGRGPCLSCADALMLLRSCAAAIVDLV